MNVGHALPAQPCHTYCCSRHQQQLGGDQLLTVPALPSSLMLVVAALRRSTPHLPHPLWSQEQCIVRQSSLISLDLHQTRTTQTCVERCFNLQRREHYKMDRGYNVGLGARGGPVENWSTSRSRTNPETLHSVHQTPPGWRPG